LNIDEINDFLAFGGLFWPLVAFGGLFGLWWPWMNFLGKDQPLVKKIKQN
jgi:hypothetical protein